jgi:aspartyl/asparaginyl-tRNA synthetase
MSKKYPEETASKHATVRLPKGLLKAIEEFLESEQAKKMGFLHITDVATAAVREFLKSHGYYPLEERFIIINHDEKGVKVFDLQNRRTADVYIRPKGIWCALCGKDSCEHIDFILQDSDIQASIRKKRKEGWNLPDI